MWVNLQSHSIAVTQCRDDGFRTPRSRLPSVSGQSTRLVAHFASKCARLIRRAALFHPVACEYLAYWQAIGSHAPVRWSCQAAPAILFAYGSIPALTGP